MEHLHKPRMHALWQSLIGPFKVKVTEGSDTFVVVDKKQKQN